MRITGHIRERGKGAWEIRYSLGKDPASGRRRTATLTVRGTRKDAEKELRRVLRALDTGEHIDPTRQTVGEWLASWLSAIREEISPKSHERYTEIVASYLVPELGALPIAKLSPAHIQAVYSKLAVGGRRDGKDGGLAPATRRYVHRVLRASLARAVEQQLLARNPADVFRKRLPKLERKELKTLTAAQSAQLLAALDGSTLHPPVLIALATGMRRGEILALRWRNVDLDRAELRVVESLEQTKSGGLRFKPPKSNKARAIIMPNFLVEQLRARKLSQAEELLAIGVRQSPDTLVCCRGDGEPLQPRSLTHTFGRQMSHLEDIPRIRFHDLRHSHATQLLLAGVHPRIAQERLGHASIAITMDLYSHVSQSMQHDAAERLDAGLGRVISATLARK